MADRTLFDSSGNLLTTTTNREIIGVHGGVFSEQSATSAPAITLITPDPCASGANFTITCTNAGATQGSGSVTIGGVTCSIVSWSDTSIVATMPTINTTSLKHGPNQDVIVTGDSNGASAAYQLDITTETDWSYQDITDTPATAAERWGTSPTDVAQNDQVRYQSFLYQSGIKTVYPVSVGTDGRITYGENAHENIPDGFYTVQHQWWDTSDQSWGTAATETVEINTSQVTGTLSVTVPLPQVTMSGNVGVSVTGTLSASIPLPTFSASGLHLMGTFGTLSASIPLPTFSATGEVNYDNSVIGTLSPSIPLPTISFTGTTSGSGVTPATIHKVFGFVSFANSRKQDIYQTSVYRSEAGIRLAVVTDVDLSDASLTLEFIRPDGTIDNSKIAVIGDASVTYDGVSYVATNVAYFNLDANYFADELLGSWKVRLVRTQIGQTRKSSWTNFNLEA